jgi:hypothetical protein
MPRLQDSEVKFPRHSLTPQLRLLGANRLFCEPLHSNRAESAEHCALAREEITRRKRGGP